MDQAAHKATGAAHRQFTRLLRAQLKCDALAMPSLVVCDR